MDSERVEFLATIPLVDGALKAHGDGGFRMVLDIPDDEAPAYVRLLLCRGKVLRVSISPEGEREPAPKRKAKRGKKQVESDEETADETW